MSRRTTNPIESTFSTVRRRTRGARSRQTALAMAYQLLDSAQDTWRNINALQIVPAARADTICIDGQLQARTTKTADPTNMEVVAA